MLGITWKLVDGMNGGLTGRMAKKKRTNKGLKDYKWEYGESNKNWWNEWRIDRKREGQ